MQSLAPTSAKYEQPKCFPVYLEPFFAFVLDIFSPCECVMGPGGVQRDTSTRHTTSQDFCIDFNTFFSYT